MSWRKRKYAAAEPVFTAAEVKAILDTLAAAHESELAEAKQAAESKAQRERIAATALHNSVLAEAVRLANSFKASRNWAQAELDVVKAERDLLRGRNSSLSALLADSLGHSPTTLAEAQGIYYPSPYYGCY